jgi:hypothetical protein
MSELAASLVGCLTVAARIHGGTGLIDHANDRPISVSYHHHRES